MSPRIGYGRSWHRGHLSYSLGRLNRDGKDQKARAFFWKIPKAWRGKQERIGPYDSPDIDLAGKLVDALISFSTANSSWQALQSHHDIHRADIEEALQPKPTPLPRAIDVHGLFSTEPTCMEDLPTSVNSCAAPIPIWT